jgi:hypothetical protein
MLYNGGDKVQGIVGVEEHIVDEWWMTPKVRPSDRRREIPIWRSKKSLSKAAD